MTDKNNYNPAVLIGLTGPAGSGKSTATELLVNTIPNVTEVQLAGPIKDMLTILLGEWFNGMEEVDWNNREWKESPLFHIPGNPSPRRLAQTLGTEWGRDVIHPDLWVAAGESNIKSSMARHFDVVVSDVRFDNEAEMIKRLGGMIVKITREEAPEVEAHVSEAGVSDNLIDAYIINAGEPEEMVEAILNAVYSFKSQKLEELYS